MSEWRLEGLDDAKSAQQQPKQKNGCVCVCEFDKRTSNALKSNSTGQKMITADSVN